MGTSVEYYHTLSGPFLFYDGRYCLSGKFGHIGPGKIQLHEGIGEELKIYLGDYQRKARGGKLSQIPEAF